LTISLGGGIMAVMASLVIRNLEDAVAERLRLQARQRGVSVEQEARRLLTEGTAVPRREIAARARVIRARQPRHRSRAVDLVRADRAR
jgi:plasmid stability protein